VNSWSGSIEIGVTTCDPSNLNFPISATGFREGTWVMSGSSILKDGHSVTEEYGAGMKSESFSHRKLWIVSKHVIFIVLMYIDKPNQQAGPASFKLFMCQTHYIKSMGKKLAKHDRKC